MKKKLTPLIMILVLAALIAGASLLYNQLSGQLAPQSFLVVSDTATPEVSASPTAEPINEPASTDEPAASTEATATPKPRIAAPDFTMLDNNGQEMKLSDFFGKPIVVNFWASWCGPCTSEMPAFQAAWEKYGQDVQFLMVNMTDGSRETIDVARSFIQEAGYTFPVYYDKDNSAAIEYAVTAIPATYLIDEEGVLVAQARGALNAEGLEYGLSLLLPEKAE